MSNDKPFQKEILDEERKEPKHDVFSVRLNSLERKWLDEDKSVFSVSRDSTAFKLLAEIGHNVLHGKGIANIVTFLASRRRIREEQEHVKFS